MSLETENRWDFQIQQGKAFRCRLLYTEDDGITPVNLAGFTASMSIKSGYEAGAADFFELTTENGGITLNAVEGAIDFYIAKAAIDEVAIPGNQEPRPFRPARYTAFFTSPGGLDDFDLWGFCPIMKEV